MHPLDAAILRTLLYADIFEYAMRLPELHRYLIHPTHVPLDAIEERLATSPVLHEALIAQNDLLCLKDKITHITKRQQRLTYMATLSEQVQRYGRWLATIPFVRMVALTGAVAVENPASGNDDLDFMLIVVPGRVWLARALSIVLVRMGRLRGVELCPNYVVASNRLEQERCDLYIAHEIAQLVPLYDADDFYGMLWRTNTWHQDWLANSAPHPIGNIMPHKRLKSLLERLLGGQLGKRLETWEFRRKSRRFQRQAKQSGDSSARINSEEVKGHFNDHGMAVLAAYQERLRDYGLEQPEHDVPSASISQSAK